MVRVLRPIACGAVALLAACATAPERSAQPEPSSAFRAGLATTTAQHHMVAAANPLATEAGHEVLNAGGSAVDAAIAVQLVLTWWSRRAPAFGGGAFLVHWDGKRGDRLRRPRNRAGRGHARLFLDADGKPMPFFDAVVGGRSVGTPGAAAPARTAHRQHGKLPWEQLFEPAIRLAEQRLLDLAAPGQLLAAEKHLQQRPDCRAPISSTPTARRRPVGTSLRNPDLPRPCCDRGRAAPTRSTQARSRADIVADGARRSSNPGPLTTGRPRRLPREGSASRCATDYRRWRVCGMPPPSSGGIAVAQMLGHPRRPQPRRLRRRMPRPRSSRAPRRCTCSREAGRLAFADRGALRRRPRLRARVNVAGLLDPGLPRAARAPDRPAQHGHAPARRAARRGRVALGADASPRNAATIAHLGGRRRRATRCR